MLEYVWRTLVKRLRRCELFNDHLIENLLLMSVVVK